MRYRVILPSGALADGQWARPGDIPDEVPKRRGRSGREGRLVQTAELKVLVEDDLGEEYEVSRWDL